MPLEIKVRAIADVSAVQQALDDLEKNARIRVPIEAQSTNSEPRETRALKDQAAAYRKLNTLVKQYDKMQSRVRNGWEKSISDWDTKNRDSEQQLARRAQITEQLTTVMNRYNKALQLEKQNFKSSAFNNVRDEISQYRTSRGGIIDLASLSQEAFAELEANLDRYARAMRQVNIEATEFTRNRSVERTINSEATALKNLSRQMSDYINANRNLINNREGYRNLTSLFDRVNTGQVDSSSARKEYSAIRAEMKALGLESETLGQRISKLFGDHFNTAVALAGINALQAGIQQLVVSVRDVDTAMTEMRKVSDLTGSELDQFLDDAASRAQSLGASLSDTVYATADAVKLGYDVDEAETLADSSLVYMNVGDNIASIDDASSSLISTMKAFNIEAENSIGIVDKFNTAGNQFSIGSGDIGEALQRSASALEFGNNSLEESIGLITAGLTTQPLLLATMECKPTKLLESPKALCTTTWQEIAGVKVAKAEKSIGIA